MTVLKNGRYLTIDNHGFLRLTDLQQETAKKIYECHCLFKAATTYIISYRNEDNLSKKSSAAGGTLTPLM